MRVAVVGGGPAGLVTLKYLATAHQFFPDLKPIEVRLFEAEAEVGGTFRYRTYENAELVSSKFLTCFSDFRPSIDEPQFMSALRYLEYLEQYCSAFKLWQHIHLSTRVVSVTRRGTGHVVRYKPDNGKEENWECDAIAICSGLHVDPELPRLQGLEKVPVVLHSSEFKSCEQFGQDKTVVILGCGETSMDLSYMAVTSPTKRVVVCHRSGWVSAPKSLPKTVLFPSFSSKPHTGDAYTGGMPIDCAHNALFDTAYVHPIVRDSMVIWNFHHYLFTGFVPWLMTGTYLVWDQWVGQTRDPTYHTSKVIFNKSNKALPYINVPYKKIGQGPLKERIRSKVFLVPSLDTHGRSIDLTSWPSHIDDTGRMHLINDGSPEYNRLKDDNIHPDIVIFATGYRHEVPFLANQDATSATETTVPGHQPERPYARPETADVRRIWARNDPTVAFIGFVRPQIGAIPTLAEMQAMLWTIHLVQKLAPTAHIPGLRGESLPPLNARDQWHYMLTRDPGNRITHGVDHDAYAYQLACDMDCAPGVKDLAGISWQRGWRKGWNIIPVWAFVSQVNPKFRLRGPWRWEGAGDVLHTEMWTLVQRNGGFLGVTLQTALPFLMFGSLNLACWVYGGILGLFGIKAKGPYTPVDEELD